MPLFSAKLINIICWEKLFYRIKCSVVNLETLNIDKVLHSDPNPVTVGVCSHSQLIQKLFLNKYIYSLCIFFARDDSVLIPFILWWYKIILEMCIFSDMLQYLSYMSPFFGAFY